MSIWNDLKSYHTSVADRSILSLFETDNRDLEFSARFDDMLFDYSKTNIDKSARDLLLGLANDAGLAEKRAAMFSGDKINSTEGRAVLHTALRNPETSVFVDGEDVSIGIRETLGRMEVFARQIRSGGITDVVNIGIGGSDLGPAMAVLALAPYCDGPRCHFVSNVDGAHISDTLKDLDPKSTLLVIASKTFTTIETMTNAKTAKAWLVRGGGDAKSQMAALSSNLEKTAEFGIPAESVFGFEDWVGGRYSIWGPIGLSLMLAIGADDFKDFLAGAASMDAHFQDADPVENLPVLLALVGIWHHQICGYPTRAVLPYDQRLSRLAAYFQQLEMESNGKRVQLDGQDLALPSGPVVWGEPGTNGQHAFYQLIHQGTSVVPCEFMVAAKGHEADLAHQHNLLLANCLAQSEALMKGRSFDEALTIVADKGFKEDEQDLQARHRVFPGNRPSTTLIYPQLTPKRLGQIIALYEHRVFVEGVILGINSFDQWGVELGKELATALGPIVEGKESAIHKDGSTAGLVAYIREFG